eukprot:gene13386-13513_t
MAGAPSKRLTDYELNKRLSQVAKELDLKRVNGVPLNDFQTKYCALYPGSQPAPDEDVIRRWVPTPGSGQGRASSSSTCYVMSRPNKDDIENAVRNTQQRMHESGQPVTVAAVEQQVLRALSVAHWSELLGPQSASAQLTSMRTLEFVERNVNLSIAAYLATREVRTLSDLEAFVCPLFEVEAFNDLQLGPLVKHCLVQANFKPPSTLLEVPQVSVVDVLKAIVHVKRFVVQKGERVKVEDIQEELMRRFNVKCFADLAVLLPRNGVGHPIQKCIDSWRDEDLRVVPQLRQKANTLARQLQQGHQELHHLVQCRVAELALEAQQAAVVAVNRIKDDIGGNGASHTSSLRRLIQMPTETKAFPFILGFTQAKGLFKGRAVCALQTELLLQPLALTDPQLQVTLTAALQRASRANQQNAQGSHTAVSDACASKTIKVIFRANNKGKPCQETGSGRTHADVLAAAASSPAGRLSVDASSAVLASLDDSDGGALLHEEVYAGLQLPALRKLFAGSRECLAQVLEPMGGKAVRQHVQHLLWPEEQTSDEKQQQQQQEEGEEEADVKEAAAAVTNCADSPCSSLASVKAPDTSRHPQGCTVCDEVGVSSDNTDHCAAMLVIECNSLSSICSPTSSAADNLSADSICEEATNSIQALLLDMMDYLYHHMFGPSNADSGTELFAVAKSCDKNKETAENAERIDHQADQLEALCLKQPWWRIHPPESLQQGNTLQGSLVASVAKMMVADIAGPIIGDSRLTELLAHYWEHDALVQLLLHIVCVLMKHGPAEEETVRSEAADKGDDTTAAASAVRIEDLQDGDGDFSASTAQRSVGLPELLAAVQDFSKGASLFALHELEQQLRYHFGISAVSDLKLPEGASTLLELLAHIQELAEAVTGHHESLDMGPVPYKAVLSLVASVKHLSYGPIESIIQSVGDTLHEQQPLSTHHNKLGGAWAALALTNSGAAAFTAHAPGLNPQHAVYCLSAAPLMADLAVWSDWDSLYAPAFGPLNSFIANHTDELNFPVLEVPGGGLLKLPATVGPLGLEQLKQGWQQAVMQGNAELLVGLLCSFIASRKGLAAAAQDQHVQGDILRTLFAKTLTHIGSNKGGSGLPIFGGRGVSAIPSLGVGGSTAADAAGRPGSPLDWNSPGEPMTMEAALNVLEAVGEDSRECNEEPLKGQRPEEVVVTPGAAQPTALASGSASAVAEALLEQQEHGCSASGLKGGRQVAADSSSDQESLTDTTSLINADAVLSYDDDSFAGTHHLGPSSPVTVVSAGNDTTPAVSTCGLAETLANSSAATVLALSDISNPCQRLIEELRRKRGLNVKLQGEMKMAGKRVVLLHADCVAGINAQAADAFSANNETLGNALEKLSEELYSNDVHFVLELVQNADDNKYGPGTCPMLELVLTSGAVSLVNNELGFRIKDVKGIADIGKSKKKGRAGYTGQKGIGFKSVFRVTQCPQIHTNGFHFAFDLRQHGNLGYVLPTWLGDQPLEPELLQALSSSVLVERQQADSNFRNAAELAAGSVEQRWLPASAKAARQINLHSILPGLIMQPHQQTTELAEADEELDEEELSHQQQQQRWLHSQGPPGAGTTAGTADNESLTAWRNLTVIHLPLKAECDEVGQKLDQLQATLLLFLRKLSCLVLTDAESQQSKLMKRIEEPGSNVVRLLVQTVRTLEIPTGPQPEQVNTKSCLSQEPADAPAGPAGQCKTSAQVLEEESHWLLVSETFTPDIPRLRYAVDETKVTLAFGLDGEGPKQQEVYAFLPVRRYGLNFMVQGDFVVPSSRQDLDLDNPWNQLLRSKVPGLFVAAFSRFQALPAPPGALELHWLDWWMKCMPLQEHMHEFFVSLPEEIAAGLMTLPCIPTEAADGGIGPLVLPSQAVVCSDPAVRILVSAEQLARLQGKHFVHPQLTALHQSRQLRRLLGVREFDPAELVNLIKNMALSGELSGSSIPQLRQLLVCVFGLLFSTPSLQQQQPWMGSASAGFRHSSSNIDIMPAGPAAAPGMPHSQLSPTGSRPPRSPSGTQVTQWPRSPSGTPVATAGGAAMGPTTAAMQLLLRELRQVPLLPIFGQPGVLVAAQGGATMTAVPPPTYAASGNCTGANDSGVVSSTPRIREQPGILSGSVGSAAKCGITMKQLAGFMDSTTASRKSSSGAAGRLNDARQLLLFVSPELLDLDTPEAQELMRRGLKELGVRGLEPWK